MGEMVSALKEQGKAIMVMLGVAIMSVLTMIVLDFFGTVADGLDLGVYNLSDSVTTVNETVQATINFFVTSFGIVGSFASITVLILVVKAIIGVVRGLKS